MFQPWIGDSYDAPDNMFDGKRVLVIGESHYASEHEIGSIVPDMTNDVMRMYASGKRERWMRTLDNVAWTVSGKGRGELEREGKRGEFSVWNSMAFYNYIPVVLADDARSDRPTAELFRSGMEPFEKVILKHQPDILVICGYGLFPWIISNHYSECAGDPWSFRGEWIDIPRQQPIRAVRMIHPSTAFSPKKWNPVIRRALTT
ncbi:hypothetical protein CO731_04775 [Aminobacter sp. MSH1]|uniref:hypothetical protein n=1 Tax=Aminobacter sp. MSH1 TaxID=374606 RepID=UPI000D34137F|nr:hypothetical protein [Aminobacter sp. MSH1]AWC25280.1 hypothetical protein CO731_04775 [Aminobacter sp. MSH1]